MARSTRALRTLLMSRTSEPIWRAARSGLGIPDGPPDLSEPKFADLLFEKGCYVSYYLVVIGSFDEMLTAA